MTNFKLSQGLEVLRPKSDKAFPIPCNEWDVLKGKINSITTEPWFFHTAGSTLIGASVATIISIWTGAVPPTSERNMLIAWAVTVGSALLGVACLMFAHAERKMHRVKAADVKTQMELIEQRFEREES